MRELNIYVDQTLVGTLGENNNIWVLDYDPAWAARDDSFDLSPALPRTTLRHLDGATLRPVQWYFDNLLPEEELRRVAAKDAGLKDQDDAFALLQYLGAESAGSLTLLPPGVPLPQDRALQPLGYPELSRRIQQLPRSSLSRQAPKRMSVAGAQHKLLVVVKGTDLYEPVGGHTLDAHPQARPPQREDLSSLGIPGAAHHAVGRRSRAVGASCGFAGGAGARVRHRAIRPQNGRAADAPGNRRTSSSRATAAHHRRLPVAQQVPPLQALWCDGRGASRGHRAHRGTPWPCLNACSRWLVFNLLVANDDCHLKNLSFIVQANTITLAPHYDLLATGVYHTGSFAGADGRWPDVEMTIPPRGPGDPVWRRHARGRAGCGDHAGGAADGGASCGTRSRDPDPIATSTASTQNTTQTSPDFSPHSRLCPAKPRRWTSWTRSRSLRFKAMSRQLPDSWACIEESCGCFATSSCPKWAAGYLPPARGHAV
jgi:serine/threonine-protein kinase HipA